VVGTSGYVPSFGFFASHAAFLWDKGVTTNLNTLLVPGSDVTTLGLAVAINDAGQIACWGVVTGGTLHGILLTPGTRPMIRRDAPPDPPSAGFADAPAVLQSTAFQSVTKLAMAKPAAALPLSSPPATPGTEAVTATTDAATLASVFALEAARPAQDLLFAAWADDAAASAWPDRLDLLGPGA
jgi:hypothetical protein